MKTTAQLKAEQRDRMRSEGYVLKQIWVKPRQWARIKRYLERANGSK